MESINGLLLTKWGILSIGIFEATVLYINGHAAAQFI